MKNALDQLVIAVENFTRYKTEKDDLLAREAAAKKEIDAAAASDTLANPEVRSRLSAADNELSHIKARLPHVLKQGRLLLTALRQALREADNAWSAAVKESAAIVRARFIKHNLKFFNGDADAAEIALAAAKVPGADDWQERLWGEDSLVLTMTEDNALILAARFSQTVRHFHADLVFP